MPQHKELLPLRFFAILFLALSGSLLAKDRIGKIHDHNRSDSTITISTRQPGLFRMGEILTVFRNGEKKGELKVSLSFHSKVLAKPISGEDFRSGDLVVEGKKDLPPDSPAEQKRAKLSYLSLAAASGWIVNLECSSGEGNITTQERKLEIPQRIAYRKSGDYFYDSVSAESVKEIRLTWDGNRLRPTSLRLSKEEIIQAEEVLVSQIGKKLKAPKNSVPNETGCKVILKERKSALDISPDALNLKINADGKYPKGDLGKTYLLKIYSNSLFLESFKIPIQNKSKDFVLGLDAENLFPGKNSIQLFWAEANAEGEENFNSSVPILLDSFEVSVGEDTGFGKILTITPKGVQPTP